MAEQGVLDVLAILGRGIQMRDSGLDPTSVWSYALTEDLELCVRTENGRLAHSPVRLPVDDSHPDSIIGGGHLNFVAGRRLVVAHNPCIVVCAYGARSPYLVSVNGPSESEVMSFNLERALWSTRGHEEPANFSEILVWERERIADGTSNTFREIQNVLDLAVEREMRRICFVTVGAHIARSSVFLSRHLASNRTYRHLSAFLLESEEVLVSSGNEEDIARVAAVRQSQSLVRNCAAEAKGILEFLQGRY